MISLPIHKQKNHNNVDIVWLSTYIMKLNANKIITLKVSAQKFIAVMVFLYAIGTKQLIAMSITLMILIQLDITNNWNKLQLIVAMTGIMSKSLIHLVME